jgi:hypothetical protein
MPSGAAWHVMANFKRQKRSLRMDFTHFGIRVRTRESNAHRVVRDALSHMLHKTCRFGARLTKNCKTRQISPRVG